MDDPGYLPLYGAEAIAGQLRTLGKPYYLYTVCGGRHEWSGKPMSDNVAEIIDFLYHDVLGQEQRQITSDSVIGAGGMSGISGVCVLPISSPGCLIIEILHLPGYSAIFWMLISKKICLLIRTIL